MNDAPFQQASFRRKPRPLVEFKRYMDIVLYGTYANLKAESERTYLGYAWWILEPLINTFLFYVVFFLFLRKTTENFLSFLLVGTITWQWFQTAVMLAANSITEKASLLRQVYLPKAIPPLVKVMSSAWKFLFVFALLLAYLLLRGHPISIAYAALPLLMVLQFLMIAGVSVPLAFVIPYFPDLQTVVDAFLRTLMLISGIFFAGDVVPEAYRGWFYVNPMAVLIEGYRAILIDGVFPHWGRLWIILAWAVVLLAFGWVLERRLNRALPKVLR